MNLLTKTLTIDPGNNTAWAYWDNSIVPIRSGVIPLRYGSKSSVKEKKMNYLWGKFKELILELQPTSVYIEGVALWSGSLKSMTSARQGDLFELSYLIGGYCKACTDAGIKFILISPTRWKGQMNKNAVKLRVYRAIKLSYKTTHETDAVGMGLSLMGIL